MREPALPTPTLRGLAGTRIAPGVCTRVGLMLRGLRKRRTLKALVPSVINRNHMRLTSVLCLMHKHVAAAGTKEFVSDAPLSNAVWERIAGDAGRCLPLLEEALCVQDVLARIVKYFLRPLHLRLMDLLWDA